MATDTEFGILIKAIDQASSTLRGVQGELDRLQRASKIAATSTTELNKAQQQLTGTLSALQRSLIQNVPAMGQISVAMDTIGAAAAGTGGVMAGLVVAVVAVGAASVASAIHIGAFQKNLDNVQLITGLTQRQIGGLTVAAAEAGKSFEDIQPSLNIFTRNLQSARDGSGTAVIAYSKLRDETGRLIDINKSESVVFEQTARAIARIEDPTKRSRIAFELFGRAGVAMIPVLLQNQTEAQALADKLGIVLTPEQQKMAREAQKATELTKLSFIGMANSIAVTLAPTGIGITNWVSGVIASLSRLQKKLQEKYELSILKGEGGGAFKTHLTDFFAHFGETPKPEVGTANELTDAQTQQLIATQKTVAFLSDRVKWGLITKVQEFESLAALRLQAISMKEMLEITEKIARLGGLSGASALVGEKARILTAGVLELEKSLPKIPGLDVINKDIKARDLLNPYGVGIGAAVAQPSDSFLAQSRTFAARLEAEMARLGKAAEDAAGPAGVFVSTVAGIVEPFLTAAGATRTLTLAVGTSLVSGFGAAVQSLVRGTVNIGQAFRSLIGGILDSLANKAGGFLGAAIFKGVIGLVSAGPAGAAAGIVGGIANSQAGGTFGVIRAQAGLVMSGTRGRDTVPALLGRGETVVSHTMTDRWDRTLSQLGSMIARMPTQAYAAAPGGNVTVPVSLTVYSHFVDRAALREFVEDHLTDLVVEAVSKGSFRRGG